MKEIIERFVLAIHWIGFLISISALGIAIYETLLSLNDVQGFALFWTSYETLLRLDPIRWNFDWASFAYFIILPITSGWLISWILTGNKSFFPWRS